MLPRETLPALWHSLQETTWQLHRTLRSTNTAEPSGTCRGTATFKSRSPTVLVGRDEKLQRAQREMLYTEQGNFHMTNDIAKSIPFTFSRKYVWRLRADETQPSEISIWFTKPGTEDIDYLFHRFLIQRIDNSKQSENETANLEIECSGGHLCVEDYYNSSYVFSGTETDDKADLHLNIETWRMRHDVRGPARDQTIETIFTRDTNPTTSFS